MRGRLLVLVVDFIVRHRKRRRIARTIRLWDVTRAVIPHVVRLNANFAAIIARGYSRAWKGERWT